jgi:hypothetical protein
MMVSAQPICPLFTRIFAPGSVPADLIEYPGKPRYIASAVKLRIRFSVQTNNSFCGWFMASLFLGCRRVYLLFNLNAFEIVMDKLLKPSE